MNVKEATGYSNTALTRSILQSDCDVPKSNGQKTAYTNHDN